MKILSFFKDLFNSILGNKQHKKDQFKKVIIVENTSSVKPQKDTITIIKKNNSYTWVKFLCPCGCGKEVALSLNSNIQPNWSIKIDKKNKVTLSPSVYLTGFPCRSHFFIRNNHIDWV